MLLRKNTDTKSFFCRNTNQFIAAVKAKLANRKPEVSADITRDGKSFIFDPVTYFGDRDD